MKRVWGIRHVRWLWHSYRCHRHAAFWAAMGIGFGFPNQADLDTLDAIWRGEI